MAGADAEGLGGLLAALEAEAEEELTRLDAETRAEADAVLALARSDAAALERGPVEAQEPELAREVDAILAAARLDAVRALRAARERAFAGALDALRARLAALRGERRYPEVLAALLAESRRALPDASIARCDRRDAGLLYGSGLRLEPTLDTLGGVVLEDGDGVAVVDTLEERLANAEPALRVALGRTAQEVEA